MHTEDVSGETSEERSILKSLLQETLHDCYTCGKKFRNHHNRRSKEKQLICENCYKFNKLYSSYLAKKRTRLACDFCHKTFAQNVTLKKHKRTQHDTEYSPPQFPCQLCDKRLTTKFGLEMHIKSIHEGVRYLCETCGRSFSGGSYLAEHIKTHSNNYKPQISSCELCDKTFLSVTALKTHVRTAHEGIRHLCDTCGKAITSNSGLQKHMKVHTGEKPYSCDYCKKKFASKQILRLHLRVHTKEKPHVCQFCGKKYSQRSPLIHHIRAVHSGERPYPCTICPKRFISKTLLKAHLKAHSNKAV